MRRFVPTISVLMGFAFAGTTTHAASLDNERRVDAHRAVERVLWERRIWPESNPGPKPPLHSVLPEAALRALVDDVLRKSNALATLWKRPIGNRELQAELDRMIQSSRDPGGLDAMFEAVGRDPILAAEAIARPALVDRLIRSWYASDSRFHDAERREAERAFATAATPEDLARIAPRYETSTRTLDSAASASDRRSPETITLDASEWRDFIDELTERVAEMPVGRIGPLEETEAAFSAAVILSRTEKSVRIGVASWPKITFDAWWSVERSSHSEVLFDLGAGEPSLVLSIDSTSPFIPSCVDDTWTRTGTGAPNARRFHSAVWTGSEMIVWGGEEWVSIPVNTGGRYNPATDTWSTLSTIGAPSPRWSAAAVWTGSKMIVWSGGTGGRYDPFTDSWSPTALAGAPTFRPAVHSIWTGSRMIVWKYYNVIGAPISGSRYDPDADSWSPMTLTGAPITGLQTPEAVWTGSLIVFWPGKRYDPVADVWTSMSTAGEPSPRSGHVLVRTGSRVIAWGGSSGAGHLNDGGLYDPSSDAWSAMATAGAPVARDRHTAVWVAGRFVVWGGNANGFHQSGGRYDPVANAWAPTTLVGAPTARTHHTAIATPTQMIVWGGDGPYPQIFNTGGSYDPTSDSWVPTRLGSPSPAARSQHSAVWTGAEMLLWGGSDDAGLRGDGGRYNPATDTWLATSGSSAPSARGAHSAVWTGTSMLVWGGLDGGYAGTGGRYDPLSDSWAPITASGAPAARTDHTAVWSGSRMIIWGGIDGSSGLGTGGRYDPVADAWLPVSLAGAPGPRTNHTAVWTGSSMIVWGGASRLGYLGTGGRYDPGADSWTPTTTTNAPTGRRSHSAVSTGSRMLVWGGYDGAAVGTGSSYDPTGNAWSPLSGSGAPAGRYATMAIWTGAEMIVWGGSDGASNFNTGGRYRPDDDSWRPTSMAAVPRTRAFHTGIWTGGKMVIWGGSTNAGTHNDGASYCSCVNWYPDADGDGYGAAAGASSVCDGTHPAGMIARSGDCNDGNAAIHPGVGDPTCNGVDEDCDTQFDEDYLPQPSACGLGVCRSFGSFDCVSGQRQNSCLPGTPNSAIDDTCNALDDDCDGPVDDEFPQYDDYWSATAAAPASRTNHTAVWSGTELIVFGGDNGSGAVQLGGNAYAPASNAWRTLAAGPLKRWHHSAVWTGSRMVVWGGDDNVATIYNTGSRYDPAANTWSATTTLSAPTARGQHSAVWADTRMVVWGGRDAVNYLNTGSRYDPAGNSWSATTTSGAPAARSVHSAVWTGTEMIVWGGLTTGQVAVNTGSRYNPSSNTWSAVTTTGAPSTRYGHVAVWTGAEMLIWGGTTNGTTYLDNGARYNPATNTWAPIAAPGAPSQRAFASAVWTGSELIVWGGTYKTNESPDTALANGARYIAANDAWTTAMTTQITLPAARARAVAVWTGSEMVVSGGDPNGAALSSGGRYNPRTLCGVGGCQRVGLTSCSGGAVSFQCTPGPATTEVCDTIDNDCDTLVDDNIPVPTAHPAVLATKLGGNVTYSWIATPDTTVYDVVRGVLGTLRSSSGNFTTSVDTCVANNLRAEATQDNTTPPVGNGYWYLVRPVNLCSGNGTYNEVVPPQVGLRDAEIAASASACP